MKKMDWVAFGDVNPVEHGGIWIREDEDCQGSFYIVKSTPVDDGSLYAISTGYVTPTDDWIMAEDVYSFADLDENSSWEGKAMAAFEYYGAENFSGETVFYPLEEVEEQLKSEGIEV